MKTRRLAFRSAGEVKFARRTFVSGLAMGGNAADFARLGGEAVDETRWIAGLCICF